MTYEEEARRQLAELQDEYRKRAAPLIKILVHLESLKPLKPIIIDMNDLSADLLEQLRKWPL